MNTSTLIDAILLRTENMTSTDAANSPRRVRILEWSQQVVDEVWNLRPWAWSMSSETITIAGGSSSGALAATFQEHGPEGGVWQTSGVNNPSRLDEVNPQVIEEMQQSSLSVAIHSVFCVSEVNDTIATQLLQVAPCAGSTNFLSKFKKIAPTLADVASTSSNLQQIPVGYHYAVILPGVQSLSARSKGSKTLQDEYTTQYRRGLDSMISREDRRRSTVRQLGRVTSRVYW